MHTKPSIRVVTLNPAKPFRIRSFVGRNSRKTDGQERALTHLWPKFGVGMAQSAPVAFASLFNNKQPCFLEIGFGMGHSLLAAAIAHPDKNFIGVETHQPGVGSLLLNAEEKNITNLRVFNADVVDVLQNMIADESLAGVQIFFPDPWQKRRHHERRLIQSEFIKLICQKLKSNGELHLATDWEDYALHMLEVVSAEAQLQNVAGHRQFGTRSIYRPVISKFENRALKEGRSVWELQCQKLSDAP